MCHVTTQRNSRSAEEQAHGERGSRRQCRMILAPPLMFKYVQAADSHVDL